MAESGSRLVVISYGRIGDKTGIPHFQAQQ
jgi:hypothetical protein